MKKIFTLLFVALSLVTTAQTKRVVHKKKVVTTKPAEKPAEAPITTPKDSIATQPGGAHLPGKLYEIVKSTHTDGHVLAMKCDTCSTWIVEDPAGLADYLDHRERVMYHELALERDISRAAWDCVVAFPLRIDSVKLNVLKQALVQRQLFWERQKR